MLISIKNWQSAICIYMHAYVCCPLLSFRHFSHNQLYKEMFYLAKKHGVNSGVSMIYNSPTIVCDRLIDRWTNRTNRGTGLISGSFAMHSRRMIQRRMDQRRISYAMRSGHETETSVYIARVVWRYSISETWKERHVMRQPLRSLL